MPIDLKPYNEEGQKHGYWVVYWAFNNQLYHKGEYVNGKRHGPWVTYFADGELLGEGTCDMGERVGLWTIAHQRIFYT